jgi:hypothetical protein
LIALALTAAILPLASSQASAGTNCKKVYAVLETSYVDDFVEVGELEGTIDGAVYLRYDDTASPIDPDVDSANFVITSKGGEITLWVDNNPGVYSGDGVWRDFKILKAEGTGAYAGQTITLKIFGKFMGKAPAMRVRLRSPLPLGGWWGKGDCAGGNVPARPAPREAVPPR